MPLQTRTTVQDLQNKSEVKPPIRLSFIILDIVAIIAILSLVLLGDLAEQRNMVEINNKGKEVACYYGQCYYVDTTVINQPYVQYPYETQGFGRTSP